MKKIGLLVLVIAIFFAGCKQAEKVVVEKKIRRLSVGRVVKLVNESELKYNTLSVDKVSLSLNDNGKVSSIRGSFKIRRDSTIQISAQKLSISVGKLEAKPDSFKMVYYLDKKVFAGNYEYITELVGIDVDFEAIQSILSNHLYSFRQEPNDKNFRDFVCNVEDNYYKISSMRKRKSRKFERNEDKLERHINRTDDGHLIKQDIYIDPDLFVVRKMVFDDIEYGRNLKIEFSEFELVSNQWFPGKINILLLGEEKIQLNIGLSKISIDDEKNFNFTVPSKYDFKILNESTF